MTVWPRPSGDLPPAGDPYAAAVWLVGRHPSLAALLDEVPGVVGRDERGGPVLRLDVLADALGVVDLDRAWTRANPAPSNDEGYMAWNKGGPMGDGVDAPPAASAVARMTTGRRVCLTLLATFARSGATVRAEDCAWLDAAGRRLLHDWSSAVGQAR